MITRGSYATPALSRACSSARASWTSRSLPCAAGNRTVNTVPDSRSERTVVVCISGVTYYHSVNILKDHFLLTSRRVAHHSCAISLVVIRGVRTCQQRRLLRITITAVPLKFDLSTLVVPSRNQMVWHPASTSHQELPRWALPHLKSWLRNSSAKVIVITRHCPGSAKIIHALTTIRGSR